MKKLIPFVVFGLLLASCSPAATVAPTTTLQPIAIPTMAPPMPTLMPSASTLIPPTPTLSVQPAQASTAVSTSGVPDFDHIVLIVLENEYLQNVIGSTEMPNLNALASQYVLLTDYYAVDHPSLPNYLALISGSEQGVSSDCTDCFVDQPNLADEIETSGRTWKAYMESMPSPCFVGNQMPYAQMDNPFIYFNSIRLNTARCDKDIVPLTQLDSDLTTNQLPNFIYIMPNLCDSGHDCPPTTADTWLKSMVDKLQASTALGQNSLIAITFDEGTGRSAVPQTRGQVATVLISPLAKQGFKDPANYSHYSLLKTFEAAWNLPEMGQSQDASILTILAPWSTGSATDVGEN